jgi:tetratricopeptide (TPR) repeat protein
MKKIILSILLAGLFGFTIAQPPKALADSATANYNKGRYEQAIAFYTKILAQGYESSEIYFNLGNSYFKSNDLPSAILNFERALKLNPGDEDIQFNLKVANSRITDKIEIVPDLFYEIWWKTLYNLFPGDTWAWIGIICIALMLIAAGFYFLSGNMFLRKSGFWVSVAMLIFAIFSGSFAWKSSTHQLNHTQAIVFDPAVTAKSSPDASSVDIFVLHEGTKVKQTDKVGEWIKIRIANGSVGWIPIKSVKEI